MEQTPEATNPKDLIGITKVPLGLLPSAGKIHGAMAMKNGAAKYGPYNWREKKIKMSIYIDALERHLLALRDGEDIAQDSGISHLGHIVAGASILLDAQVMDCLIDDRPKGGPAAQLISDFAETK